MSTATEVRTINALLTWRERVLATTHAGQHGHYGDGRLTAARVAESAAWLEVLSLVAPDTSHAITVESEIEAEHHAARYATVAATGYALTLLESVLD